MARKRKAPGLEDSISFSWVEIMKRIEKRTNLPAAMLTAAYKEITEEIMIVLEEGNSVALQKFGTFEMKTRGGKFNITKVAPQGTGSPTVKSAIPPMKYIKFTPARVAQMRMRKAVPKDGSLSKANTENSMDKPQKLEKGL